MNKLKTIVLLMFLGTGAMAQNFSPSVAEEIKKGVVIEILEVNRVEKYGWDNLEVKYNVKNNSSYDVQKLDFVIHLFDSEKSELGAMEVHAFRIPKATERTINFVEIGSAFVNADINQFIAETTTLDVILENDQVQTVSIKTAESIVVK